MKMSGDERLSAVERLNTEYAKRAHEQAVEFRREALALACDAVALHFEYDRAGRARLQDGDFYEGEEFEFFVTEDHVAAPIPDDEQPAASEDDDPGRYLHRTLSLVLAPDPDAPDFDTTTGEMQDTPVRRGAAHPLAHPERLKIYIPVPESVSVNDGATPDLQQAEEIYLEYSFGDDATPIRYVLNRDWFYEYTSAADPGQQQVLYGREEIIRRLGTMVDDAVITLPAIFRDMVIMKAVPQRTTIIGLPEAQNL